MKSLIIGRENIGQGEGEIKVQENALNENCASKRHVASYLYRLIDRVPPLSLDSAMAIPAGCQKKSRDHVKSKEQRALALARVRERESFGSYRARRYERHRVCFTAQLNTI